MHSPLVFDLITKVLIPAKSFYVFDVIENERTKLLLDQRTILVQDFGAGSRKMKAAERRISDIAKYSLQPPKHAQSIFKLLQYFKPQNILELGTSLGVTTSYMASVSANCRIWTIEGADEVADVAQSLFQRLKLTNVRLEKGAFDAKLPVVISDMTKIDCALIDGHHAFEPTMRYYREIRKITTEESIVILDDIHWSEEMERAWMEITKDPDVTLSLDFFHFGVVFFNRNRVKEHFRLKLP